MGNVTKPQSVQDLLSAGINPTATGETATPATPAVPAAAVTGIDAGLLGQLVALMVAERAENLKTNQEIKARVAAIEKQRSRNAKDQEAKRIAKQATCKHLKGVGKHTPKGAVQRIDYAVVRHRFINFQERIMCRICGAKWRQGDTDEYFLRNGRQIPNHTHIGWARACAMVDQSSDTFTASEAVVVQNGAEARAAAYVDKEGRAVSAAIVDKDGEIVHNFEM